MRNLGLFFLIQLVTCLALAQEPAEQQPAQTPPAEVEELPVDVADPAMVEDSLPPPGPAVSETLSLPAVIEQAKRATVKLATRNGKDRGVASGIIIEPGIIMTNNHAVDGAKSIRIHFSDGTRVSTSTIRQDKATDLAMVLYDSSKGPQNGFPPYRPSEQVQVGEEIFAIGFPYDFSATVTVGHLSGKHQKIEPNNANTFDIEDFLTTDVALNNGNSGGPLLDKQGNLIGINTLVMKSNNVSLAIPSELIEFAYRQLKEHETIDRGFLGIYVKTIPANGGVRVTSLPEARTPGKTAGIEKGDIILQVDGKRVLTENEVYSALATHLPGDKIKMNILRGDDLVRLTVTLGHRPSWTSAGEAKIELTKVDSIGISVAKLNQKNAQKLISGFKAENMPYYGVIIASLEEKGIGVDGGLESGMIITHVDNNAVSSPDDLVSKISAANLDDGVQITVQKANGNIQDFEIAN